MKKRQKEVAHEASEETHAPPGTLCLILPTDDGPCLGAIVFVAASLPVAETLTAALVARKPVAEEMVLYSSPSLAAATLPPEA